MSSAAPRDRVLAAVARCTPPMRPVALFAERPLRPVSTAAHGGRARSRARGRAERRADRDSRSWESRQPWIGAPAAGRERALVAVAIDTVVAICATAAWGSPLLSGHRDRLDLAAALDEIDAQAYALASLAPGVPAADVEEAWLAAVDRVAALDAYAANLAAFDRGLAALDATHRTPGDTAEVRLGAQRDRDARVHLGVLVDELDGLSAAVAELDGR